MRQKLINALKRKVDHEGMIHIHMHYLDAVVDMDPEMPAQVEEGRFDFTDTLIWLRDFNARCKAAKDSDYSKIPLIKELRGRLSCGLKEAKDYVDGFYY